MTTRPPRHLRATTRHRALGALVGVLALAGAAVGVTAGVAPHAARAATDSRSSTFITTLDTSVSTFNPFLAFEQGEIDTIDMIYPSLTFGREDNNPGPWLATSWTVSKDKLTWTFHLRTGLKWSDGTPLTAADAAWTYNLILHNETAATANGSLLTNFKTVTAPNASTLVITTTKPQANMLNDVQQVPIVPEHIWKAHVKGLGNYTNTQTPVVGYGPFQFTGYQPGQSVTLTANPTWWGGQPKYHKLILNYYANSSGAAEALRNGEVDSSYNITDTEWKSLRSAPGMKTYQTLTNDWIAVEVNGNARTRSGQHIGDGNPLLKDPAIRRAIAIGINRDTLVQKVAGGSGVVSGSYLTPAFPQWYWQPPKSQAQNYDPAKANALLDRAGYPKGKDGYRVDKKTGKELSFRLGIHSESASDAQTANYLVGWMKSIGIKLTVQSMSNTQLNDNLAVGNWDLLMDQWPEGADPTYLLSIQTCGVLPKDKNGSGGNTDAFFCNQRYDKLFADEQTQFDHAKRAQDIKAMEKILYGADYDIILYDDAYEFATKSDYTKGYLHGSPNGQGLYPLQNYELGWIKGVPASATSGGGGGGSGSTVLIVIIVVLVLALGGGFLFTRRRGLTVEERE